MQSAKSRPRVTLVDRSSSVQLGHLKQLSGVTSYPKPTIVTGPGDHWKWLARRHAYALLQFSVGSLTVYGFACWSNRPALSRFCLADRERRSCGLTARSIFFFDSRRGAAYLGADSTRLQIECLILCSFLSLPTWARIPQNHGCQGTCPDRSARARSTTRRISKKIEYLSSLKPSQNLRSVCLRESFFYSPLSGTKGRTEALDLSERGASR